MTDTPLSDTESISGQENGIILNSLLRIVTNEQNDQSGVNNLDDNIKSMLLDVPILRMHTSLLMAANEAIHFYENGTKTMQQLKRAVTIAIMDYEMLVEGHIRMIKESNDPNNIEQHFIGLNQTYNPKWILTRHNRSLYMNTQHYMQIKDLGSKLAIGSRSKRLIDNILCDTRIADHKRATTSFQYNGIQLLTQSMKEQVTQIIESMRGKDNAEEINENNMVLTGYSTTSEKHSYLIRNEDELLKATKESNSDNEDEYESQSLMKTYTHKCPTIEFDTENDFQLNIIEAVQNVIGQANLSPGAEVQAYDIRNLLISVISEITHHTKGWRSGWTIISTDTIQKAACMQGKYATSAHCARITSLVSATLKELSIKYNFMKRDKTSAYGLFRSPTGESEWLNISDKIAEQLYSLKIGERTMIRRELETTNEY